ncbi:hypothetical protein BGX23_005842 [Mortierella sp. AD031]|nr:hypothetical protein BGX23_005842 [Mortierella sp. AD031]KAG0208435.1 hypothetical protein BGX33_006237 [Mortierella sp. NVP41]
MSKKFIPATAMSPAFDRVFDILELVDLLKSQRAKADISRLAQANRMLHATCSPSLYRSLNANYGDASKIFSFVPGMLALGRNIGHVTALSLRRQELAF